MAYKAAPVPMAPAVFSWTASTSAPMLAEPGPATTAAVISHRCSRPYRASAGVAIPTVIPGQLASLVGGGRQSGRHRWRPDRIQLAGQSVRFSGGKPTRSARDESSTATPRATIGAPIFAVPVTQTVTVDFGHIEWMATFRGAPARRQSGPVLCHRRRRCCGVRRLDNTLRHGPGTAFRPPEHTCNHGGSTTALGLDRRRRHRMAFNQNWSVAGEYRHNRLRHRGTNFDIPSGLAAAPIFFTGTSSCG